MTSPPSTPMMDFLYLSMFFLQVRTQQAFRDCINIKKRTNFASQYINYFLIIKKIPETEKGSQNNHILNIKEVQKITHFLTSFTKNRVQ